MEELNINIFYLGVGFVVMANLGTIITVWVISIKIAMAFKAMQKDVEKNTKDLQHCWDYNKNNRTLIRELADRVKDV